MQVKQMDPTYPYPYPSVPLPIRTPRNQIQQHPSSQDLSPGCNRQDLSPGCNCRQIPII